MDDTLFETPKFSDFVGVPNDGLIDDTKYFPDYFKKLKVIFIDKMNKNVAFEKKGDFVIPINKETGKPFPGEFIEYFKEKKFQRYFDVHDNNLVIKSLVDNGYVQVNEYVIGEGYDENTIIWYAWM